MGEIQTMLEAGKRQLLKEVRVQLLLLLGIVLLAFLVVPPVQFLFDKHVRARPFVTATVQVVAPDEVGDKPHVKYAVHSSVAVNVLWSAWVDVNGRRTCGGGGQSGHGPEANNQDPKIWDWENWLQKDCPVPRKPFSLCVRYVATTHSMVGDVTAPYCSETYDPRVIQ